ncbi:toll/interleukin-1 receptor domain-containing protein [Lentzea sp. NPDC003310]|uniref:toll/interleukin-1 receptor domain-containing protein n=1 Tax=Lentzea sp. NPDC003310 TaxID=3154447 RepID=UPI0033BCBE58
MTGDHRAYDVAVSFAGAQRDEVEPLVRACQQLGVKVFYDKDKTVEFWGSYLHYDMRDIYGGAQARYFMPFLSREYLASPWPMDEFHAAALHALEIMGGGYILPIMVGDVQVPSRLLSRAIGYLKLENYTTDELAGIVARKVSR